MQIAGNINTALHIVQQYFFKFVYMHIQITDTLARFKHTQ